MIEFSGQESTLLRLKYVYKAGAVIVAAGGYPRKLDIPGEDGLAGKGVSYCALCDGPFFMNQDIAVVGGGNSAVE